MIPAALLAVPARALDNTSSESRAPPMIDPKRYPHLAHIETPEDLRKVPETELEDVAHELRAYLIESVATSGGHFGAGLGVVELTVALH